MKHFLFTLKPADYVSVLNGLSGATSIIFLLNGDVTTSLFLILFSIVLDFLDGRVARLTGGSEFGKDIDSLCDIISFGLAPALSIIILFNMNIIGLVLGFAWITSGILRLARFNVLNIHTHFLGIPITLAAGIVTVVHLFTGSYFMLAILYIALSVLMLSDLKIKKI